MRRFPSGTVDQYIYFVAVDSTDLKTRETGLTTFTVYRARNGAAAAAYTTPTVAEVSSSNMPGVYSLLLDEDMTIASGNKSEEVVLHITQASMAPVTLVFEIYRPDVTEGETLTVSSGAVSTVTTTTTATNVTTVNGLAANVITAASIATGAIDADALAADAGTEIGTAVWATAARTLTANTNLNDPTAAAIADAVWDEAQVDHVAAGSFGVTASEIADILVDTAEIGTAGAGLTALATQASVNIIDDFLDTEIAAILADTNELQTDWVNGGRLDLLIDAIKAKTDNLPAAPAATGDVPTAAAVADAVWDEVLSGHLTAGSTGNALNSAGSAGDPWGTALPGAYGAGSAGYILGTNLDATVSSRASQTSVDTVDGIVDAILIDTAEIGAAGAGLTAVASAANLATVAGYLDTEVTAIKAKTDNLPAAPAAVGDIPTANQNADALLDRANGIETGYTLRQTARLMAAVLLGKLSGGGTATEVFRDVNDTKDRVTATVDASGNRTAITRDAT